MCPKVMCQAPVTVPSAPYLATFADNTAILTVDQYREDYTEKLHVGSDSTELIYPYKVFLIKK